MHILTTTVYLTLRWMSLCVICLTNLRVGSSAWYTMFMWVLSPGNQLTYVSPIWGWKLCLVHNVCVSTTTYRLATSSHMSHPFEVGSSAWQRDVYVSTTTYRLATSSHMSHPFEVGSSAWHMWVLLLIAWQPAHKLSKNAIMDSDLPNILLVLF